MTQHTTIDATVRNAALRLLANGDATVAEVAELLGASRQRVQYWADQAGLEVELARRSKITRLLQDRVLINTGKVVRHRLPKRRTR